MAEGPNRGATLPTMMARAGRWAGVLALALALFAGLPAAVVRADEHEIAITDTGFDPDRLTVIVGEPVTWTNATTTEHAILTADGSLDSGPIGPGEAFGHVFEAPGPVEYYEAGNPRIIGTIIVMAAPVTESPSTEAPSGSAASTPPSSGSLPSGSLPLPEPSPAASSENPPSATPSAVASPSATATPVVVTTQSGGNGSALFLAVAVVGAIAVLAAIAGLIGASRRPGR